MDQTLEAALAREYPFTVIADPDGGYVIEFPDLPGCMTQIETLDEVGAMAEEIRSLWIETAFDMGNGIPAPSYPEEYSGRFVLRMPKSLHRTLAAAAARDDVSLNSYACGLLATNDALAQVMRRMDGMEVHLQVIQERLRYQVAGVPATPRRRGDFVVVDDEYGSVAA